MQFKASFDNPKPFTDIVSLINVLIDEATFNLTPEAITVRVMDASRVCMLDLSIPKTFCSEYVVTESTKLCINVSELLKLLKRGKKDEKTTIELNNEGKLQLVFGVKMPRTFIVPTLEPSNEEMPTPNLDMQVKASIATHGLIQTLEDAQLVSDHIIVTAVGDTLRFNAEGDIMKASVTMKKGETDELLDIETKTDSKAIYSLSYLLAVAKAAATLTDIVIVQFSKDVPVKLEFVDQQCKITFYLAPRIETEA
jgi:proliferating cell nuclear antigen PCNA